MLATTTQPEEWTERQREVLDATLALLIENAAGVTTIGVARRASCSKETLYKWFGDREGLLSATVRYQASKVRVAPFDATDLDRQRLSDVLSGFASGLLGILTSEVSVALNRLAISQADSKGKEQSKSLGAIVLENGRFSTGPRLKPAIEAGMAQGLLAQGDSEEAFRTFYGLAIRDVQIRILLGEDFSLSPDEIEAEANRATQQFFTLYAVSTA